MFSAERILATISRGWRLDRDDDGIFIRARLLQRFELAVKQASRHEMLVPCGDTARDQLLIAFKINQTNVGTISDQNIAVAALESGACDDARVRPNDASCRSRQRPLSARANDPHQ